MLAIENISKTYDETVSALDHVSLTVARGEIVCLLGPSGCGKTTLLRIVAGLEEPTSGRVLLEGNDLAATAVHKRHFGYMFQDYALFPHKSVDENVAFGLRMQNESVGETTARVEEMLQLVGLAGYGSRSIFELSGGERQRVALARSLAPSPSVLLLDEPLGSLDRALRESLTGELRTILKQVSVTSIYVTHDQQEAFAIGDRIAVMMAGHIVQQGPPEAVYQRPQSARLARFLGFSSLLPVTPSPSDPDLVGTPLGEIPRSLLPEPVPHDGGLLLIRPDSARIVSATDFGAVTYPYLFPESASQTARLIVSGYLCGYTFRGSQYRITVRAPAPGGDIELAFDLPAYQSDLVSGELRPFPLPPLDEPIWLAIYPQLTAVLPAEGEGEGPSTRPE